MFQRCTISLVLFLVSNVAFAQYLSEKAFIRHLSIEGLLKEKNYLLMTLKDSNHTAVLSEKGWTVSELGNSKLALNYYQRCDFDTLQSLGFSGHYLKLLFMNDSISKIQKLLNQPKNAIDSALNSKMDAAINMLKSNASVQIPDYLSNSYSRHLLLNKKSLEIATALSVLIPGLGKIYIKKPRQGLNMLLANLIFGIQAVESYKKAGPESLRFIAFGALFTAFYTGNIYGTYKGLKKARRDSYQQLKYEIEEYYLAGFGHYPNQ